MLKTGMIIAERYEILSKIGTGGMADVYKAKDHKLNRFVAVKVLKPEFREDTTFIRKFRSEAQAAAGLTHPNIVNVFDVGDDEGVYYIVMELIEGITLKEYIAKKGKLSIKEATSIAIQVSMGLEAAHNHGIVHRDVKPQNIIISTDGKVKVTDFGIARAASSNTISSNVMGSVHYSSPEQVRGGYSDEKSDIYSLGITLYEMVTGRVPFDGDTTVAIAIKHLQEEMVPPSVYTEELPYSLEQIILKCTQKSVNRRYEKMEDVIADLKHSLIDPQGNFVKLSSVDNEAKTVVISDEELGEIKHTPKNRTSQRKQDVAELEDEVLDDDNYTFLLVAHQLSQADDSTIDLINELYDYSVEHGYQFYCLTSSPDSDIEDWQERTGAEYPFCLMDDITLKTMIRSNPGLMLLKNGVVINKWSVNSLPDEYVLTDRLEKLPLAQINEKTFSHKVVLVLAWFVFPLLFFSMVDVIWEHFHRKKKLKENRTK